ncbi:hypothetical protein PhCBS80983_g05215 [Powellomyces hirtus]|uniref:BHLH domain-containing protein n=1 Tax=Powellomyces hirtus TaxID=109895 RepID=A0A507DVR5_9FUNG|nr:hypothetical protein PhCBS80983_g05215 [Powellomyces hirtus]
MLARGTYHHKQRPPPLLPLPLLTSPPLSSTSSLLSPSPSSSSTTSIHATATATAPALPPSPPTMVHSPYDYPDEYESSPDRNLTLAPIREPNPRHLYAYAHPAAAPQLELEYEHRYAAAPPRDAAAAAVGPHGHQYHPYQRTRHSIPPPPLARRDETLRIDTRDTDGYGPQRHPPRHHHLPAFDPPPESRLATTATAAAAARRRRSSMPTHTGHLPHPQRPLRAPRLPFTEPSAHTLARHTNTVTTIATLLNNEDDPPRDPTRRIHHLHTPAASPITNPRRPSLDSLLSSSSSTTPASVGQPYTPTNDNTNTIPPHSPYPTTTPKPTPPSTTTTTTHEKLTSTQQRQQHHQQPKPHLPPTLSNNNSSNSNNHPYSRSPQLRVVHKLAERKRRKEIKELFDDLKHALPQHSFESTRPSKWELLSKAVEYIASLEDARHERDQLRTILATTNPTSKPSKTEPE